MKPLELHRKEPQQGRSRGLVNAILEATVRILPKTGSRQITTRKIAEIAGVSIGSLYQYFPNKESVLSSLIDLSMNTLNGQTYRMIAELEGKPLDECVDRVVDFAVNLLLSDRAKIREIFMQAPELGKIPSLFHQRQNVVESLATLIEDRRPGLSREKYVLMSFTAVNAVIGVIHTMLYDQTQTYDNGTIAAEAKSMAKAYIHQELEKI